MNLMRFRLPAWSVAALVLVPISAWGAEPIAKVDYNRDIRPILSENCFACHGPDAKARKAELRLDSKDDVLRDRSGFAVVVPGDLEASELIQRIRSDDPFEKMPPSRSRKTLTPAQIKTIERWVAAGAPWKEHWAFQPPERHKPPSVSETAWPRNLIDRFVLARLEAEGLQPTREAQKTTLIRRVTLDLTGLPPTPQEVDAFLADTSPESYEKLVDRLLRSPHYGEHMARFWLDAARYGDTHGLHLDNYREIWPYRDWVINAFNRNLPFDRLVTEQLAGDLLPNPTIEQIIATGFNRAHVTTSEGGSIEEEVYVRNVDDRVDTTGIVFLGLTIGCARCHDHKYDPITQKDYYQLFAIFNSLDEKPLDGNIARPAPIIEVPTPEQKAAREKLQQQIAALRRTIAQEVAKAAYDEAIDANLPEYLERSDYVWFDDAIPAGAKVQGAEPGQPWTLAGAPDQPVLSGSKSARVAGEGTVRHEFQGAEPQLLVGEGDILFASVFIDPTDPPKELMLQWHSDGWKHRAYWGDDLIDNVAGSPPRHHVGPLPRTGKWVRLEVEAAKLGLKLGSKIDGWAVAVRGGTAFWDRAGLETWTPQPGQKFDSLSAWVRSQRTLTQQAQRRSGVPKDIRDIVRLERSKRSPEQRQKLRDYFVENAYSRTRPTFEPLHKDLTRLERTDAELSKQIPASLISHELSKPRPAFILKRGDYDRRGEPVSRATPAFLLPLPKDVRPDRLGFAKWLVSPQQPLTARVAVNRFWQQCFGTGLVKTSEDFGSQGQPPSHPELLDWLATEFRESGWDTKALMKLIVASATYRQSSQITKDRLAKDPDNRLLSRGPRFRLDAEMIRDQALFVGDLLVETVGGPSVKPPQPAGLWEAVAYTASNTAKFVADTEHEKVHRRSLYTFWKRTAAPPQMVLFDAPSRESCMVRRERTNTPLQALMLMNEPQLIEAARGLAERVLDHPGTTSERLASLFQWATARRPDDQELAELNATLNEHLAAFAHDTEAARKFLGLGQTKPNPAPDCHELAAWTMIANLVLNLDEVITKG
jgi:hypothetical protein